MIPDNLNLDQSGPFRRHPWLYALVGLVAIGIVAVLIFGAWYAMNQKRSGTRPPSGSVETEGERTNRLAIMNVLNTFHIKESMVASDTSAGNRLQTKKEHVQEVIEKLESARTGGVAKSAQDDLLAVFKKWRAELDAKPDVLALKNEFVTIAQEYPWLNTLVWIIILNRL